MYCRYAGQACILGQSNLSQKQVDHLLEGSTEDATVRDTLKNTDVLLSLNKKKRWGLPATMRHMIRDGRFSQNEAMVSVLERHKLKRRANCVGFACSKQANLSGQDSFRRQIIEDIFGQKTYFSFNMNSFENEESRRRWKKRMAEMRIKLSQQKKRVKKETRRDMETVNVMTVEGVSEIKKQTVKKPEPSNKPEYTLEVFYPCPQSCSLTFNPKYTDVMMKQNDDGEMEVKSNVKSAKKSQRKHRRKFVGGNLAAIRTEARHCEEDVEEMWREEYTSLGSENHTQDFTTGNGQWETVMTTSHEDKENGKAGEPDKNLPNDFSESILSCLIDQAERARAQWSSFGSRSRHRRKSGRDGDTMGSMSPRSCEINTSDDKTHISYIKKEEQMPVNTKGKCKNPTETKQKPEPVLTPTPVILPSSEVSPANLTSRFGQFYSEANCIPRRFCVNITEDVANLLSVYRSVNASAAYTTFVVFTSKGVYDEGLESYDVFVNCAACLESGKITQSLPNRLTTLDSVINTFAGNLLDMKEAGELNINKDLVSGDAIATFTPRLDIIMERMKVKVDSFFTTEKISWNSETEYLKMPHETDRTEEKLPQSLMKLTIDSETDIFCDICYENINPAQIDTASGTQLKECGHLFCDKCWRAHLRTQLGQGAPYLTCPGYQCDSKLELSTLLSLLHVTEVAKFLIRALEGEVESCPTAKWCPNPNCGRVIRLNSKLSSGLAQHGSDQATTHNDMLNLDVSCSCGQNWCFSCLSPAHWPARCEQAQSYLDKVSSIKPIKEIVDEEPEIPTAKPKYRPPKPVEVEGRLCPRCLKFIQKNGGCTHMVCTCQYAFCWKCMGPWHYKSTCLLDAGVIYKYSRRVVVHHLAPPPGFGEEENREEKKVPAPTQLPSRRQKASMYQKALQQRTVEIRDKSWIKQTKELVSRICKGTGKDLQFKREVRKVYAFDTP